MSTGKLTATVFMAGPEDKLGVVDVYEQVSDSIVNSYQEQFHNVMDSLRQSSKYKHRHFQLL